MKVMVLKNPDELGREAAIFSANILNKAITEKGKARLILSTGASQFDTLKYLVKQNVDWNKVEMFHLDEYVGLPETHPASFRKYLKERFTNLTHPRKAFFVDGERDPVNNIQFLTEEIRKEPIDLALIGIGENGHLAFNDPPADFKTKEAFIIVNLDENCKKQQVREGWFPTVNDVPKQAISMTVYQIMQSQVIVSCVPYKVKANAVKMTLEKEMTNLVPATILKNHHDVVLFLEEESASLVDRDVLNKYL
jgi:glucosamine-6-phosphate deaminase